MSIDTEAPAGAAPLAPPRQAFIERSHQRSEALGLKRHEKSGFDPLVRSDLNVARERNQRLYTHAAPVMQLLYEQIVNTESMIVLTDAQGTILHAVGDDSFLARAHRVALAPGENWAEHAKGTNAIGTALFEEAPTLVHGGEHFMHANSFLTCSASPIFDPRGNMLGVLDVTGDHRGYHQHTMGLVRMSARMIENHWLSDDYNNRLRLHFHSRPEFIGTLLEGILVVSPDGRLLGANRAALDQLGMRGAELRARSLSSLLGTTPAAVYDHFRMPLSPPMQVSLPTGQTLFVTARFDWPSRPVVAGMHVADAEVAEVREPAPAVEPVQVDATGAQRFSGLQYLRTGDPQLETVIQKVRRVLDRGIPLLVLGETGTGKELLARAVHHDSNRSRQPFVAVNCASIPESLIEAELFGYEEGAFTGARRKGAPGRLVQANGGTLFLDEIGDMPLALQARLLRALQERSVTPLGSTKSIAVDIAVIGATHRNLRDMIAAQTFREDLYYRLNGLALRLPALRERTDLEAIVRRILQAERPQDTPELSPQVLGMFRRYQWPGNIRQLANVLRTAAVMSAGERLVTTAHLSDDFLEDMQRAGGHVLPPPAPAPAWASYEPMPVLPAPAPVAAPAAEPATARTLGQAEIDMIRATLDAVGGNISLASKQLGISRNTIYRKLRWNAAGEQQPE
ncbi:sigma-54-dependent Fis family transcriptional regulator [Roseateles sp. BYS78W]|uniref:Sigma-54-dependent Fis family transcriptional regulator n=1 Tax=Pelomonas candidula TaxID=3299025 RepID=A0ABW7HFU5_9BURK